jgi:hypothetical protein
MKKAFLEFLLKLFILTVIIGILSYVMYLLLPDGFVTPFLPYIFLLFFLVNAGVYYFQLRSEVYSPRKIVSFFMLATFGKMFIYIIAVTVYLFSVGRDIPAFIINFFIIYIVYLVFEVVTSLSQAKRPPA